MATSYTEEIIQAKDAYIAKLEDVLARFLKVTEVLQHGRIEINENDPVLHLKDRDVKYSTLVFERWERLFEIQMEIREILKID